MPTTCNALIKLDPSFSPVEAQVLTTVVDPDNYYTTIESKGDEVILGGILSGLVNVGGSLFSRTRELVFINLDTSLASVNWFASTLSDFSNTVLGTPFDQGIFDCTITNDNSIYFSGGTGVTQRTYGDFSSSPNSINNGSVTKLISCNPITSSIAPANPVICGSGSTVTLTGSYNTNLDVNWLYSGSPLSGSIGTTYVTPNVGPYALVLDSLGCKDTSATVDVILAPIPTVTTPNTTLTVCYGRSLPHSGRLACRRCLERKWRGKRYPV